MEKLTVERKRPMTSPVPSAVPSSVAELKARWKKISVVDHALAVYALHKAGKSFRIFAGELGHCSATQLRKLNQAAQASSEDIKLAREKKISINELIKRSRATAKQRAAQDKEALKKKQIKDAQRAALAICDWAAKENLWPTQADKIIYDARLQFEMAEVYGTPPSCPQDMSNLSVAEIISRTRPATGPEPGNPGWFSRWLVNWALCAFPDKDVRHKALCLAEEYEFSGIPKPQKKRGK
jgi:hypothetical protein